MSQAAAKTQAETALATAVALRDLLVDEGDTWAVEQVEREIATARVELDDAVHELREEYGVAGNEAVEALLQVAAGLLDLGAAVNAGRARVVEWTMPRDGSAALAAVWRYGDVSRRIEIIELNHLADPNRITQGQVLQVLAT